MDIQLNLLDIALLVIVLLSAVRGFFRGLVDELAGFIGIFAGVILAARFYKRVMPYLDTVLRDPTWQAIVAWALIFVAVLIVVGLLANLLRRFFQATSTTFVNQILGCALGGAKGILLCAVLLGLLKVFLPDVQVVNNSTLAPHVNEVLRVLRAKLPELENARNSIMKHLPLGDSPHE